MTPPPFFSIITVVKNSAALLEKTIQSVLNQGCKNFEYILIDGVSTDRTLDIIQQYARQINYWESSADKGIYDAMNKGLARAGGKYVYFLNSGDLLFDQDVLENIVELANHTNADLIYGDILRNESGVLSYVKMKSNRLKISFKIISHQAVFIKRNAHPFFNLDFKIVADYAVQFKTFITKTNAYYPQPVAIYLAGGFSEQMRSRNNDEKLRVVLQNGNSLDKVLAFLFHRYQKYKLKYFLKSP